MLTLGLVVTVAAGVACVLRLGWLWLQHWLLSLDPWPAQCECGDLTRHAPGDIATARTEDNEARYRRLFLGGAQGSPPEAASR